MKRIFMKIWKTFYWKPSGTEGPTFGLPTVKFDPSRVTDEVKTNIRKNVESINGLDPKDIDQVYEAALRSVSAGGNLFLLSNTIMQIGIDGMTKKRAGRIAGLLNNRAFAIIERNRQLALGITEAIWMYSGAPCGLDPKKPGRLDAAHRAANEKKYRVAKCMYLNKRWTWPGCEEGCRCTCRAIVPGIETK